MGDLTRYLIVALFAAAVQLLLTKVGRWRFRRSWQIRGRSDDGPVMRAPVIGTVAAAVLAVAGLVIVLAGAAGSSDVLDASSGDKKMMFFGLALFAMTVGVLISGLQWRIRAEPDAISQVTSWGSVRRIRYQDVEELRIDRYGQFQVSGSDGTVIRSTGRSDPGPVLEALICGAGLVQVSEGSEKVFRRPESAGATADSGGGLPWMP